MKNFMYALSALTLVASPVAFAQSAHTGLVIGGQFGLSAAQSKQKAADNTQSSSTTMKKNAAIGGLFARYGFTVQPNIIAGPQISLNLGGLSLSKNFQEGGVSAKGKLTRRYQAGLGGYVRYLVTPQTAVGFDAALLIAPFRSELSIPSANFAQKATQTKYGLGIALGVEHAVSDLVSVGGSMGYNWYQTAKTKQWPVGNSGNQVRLENTPSSWEVMLRVGFKVGGA